MRYFEEHRRKLIKKEKIAGAPSIRQVSEDSELCLNECGGTIAEFSILGNTVQDGTPSPEKPRLIKNSGEYHAIEYTSEVMEKLRSGNYGTFGVTGIVGKSLDDLSTKVLTFSLTQEMQGAYTVGLLKGENWLFGETIQITTTPIRVTGYDYIYVTNVMTLEEVPTLFDNVTVNVIEELTSGGNGIDVELKGKNLWYKGDVKVTNGTKQVFLSTPLLPGTYVLSADVYSSDTDDSTCLIYNLTTGKDLGVIRRGNRRYFKFDLDEPCDKLLFYASRLWNTSEGDTATFANIQIELDTEPTEYEPYFEPVTVNIPSEVTLTDGTVVPLLMGEGDTLTIDNHKNKVIYASTFDQYTFTGDEKNWLDVSTLLNQEGKSRFRNNLILKFYLKNKKAYSTINNPVIRLSGQTINSDYGIQLYSVGSDGNSHARYVFFTLPTMTLAEFRQWLKDNPTTLRYEIETPVEYDLTDTEVGKQLLALSIPYGNDCIIKVKGQDIQPSLGECVYNTIDETLEDKLSLTIFYKDTEGNELAPSQVHLLRKGTSYSVKPLNIEGYVVTDEYKGVIKENTEITIEYVGGKNEGI